MKKIFKPGDSKLWSRKVVRDDLAAFQGELVHPVCSTFSMARDFEWASRAFVLEMKEDHEEGVGTFLTVEHKAPAWEGDEITYKATLVKLQGNEISCSIEARVGDRLVARGATGQKIMKKENLKEIFKK